MPPFELNNDQRKYFGLNPIHDDWSKVILDGDAYRPASLLYYEDNRIKRQVISTAEIYHELEYDEVTRERKILVPKTAKGKEQKLSASVLEKRKPLGVYLYINPSRLIIASHNTQTTFYSSDWDHNSETKKQISEWIDWFISASENDHLQKIAAFKHTKRQNAKFKPGDYFTFKLSRTTFGFGRILLDVQQLRKRGFLTREHGLNLIMARPIFIQLFIYSSSNKNVSIDILNQQSTLPSDVMMDNHLLYGEYEIIDHRSLIPEQLEFPVSYGRSIDSRPVVFLQWGMIHKEIPLSEFNKYLNGDQWHETNPYGYYGIGFTPGYNSLCIIKALKHGSFGFEQSEAYRAKYDLRNPLNKNIREELLRTFGLDPNKSYFENCMAEHIEPIINDQ